MPNSPSSPSPWVRLIRAFGLLLLAYVLVMTFAVPLGPGIVDVRVSPGADEGRQTTFALEIEGHNTHFSESIPLVFLKRGEHFVVIRDLEVIDDGHLAGRVTLDKFVPALSWDVFVNSPVDGTMSFANGFFAQGLTASNKAKSPDNDAVLDRLSQADLGFHFPFQPNIMETIRNLMLHVPMWFTMFLLMGISFAQSIRSLGTSGTAEHDMKALASVKTGMWFGVLGLLTGSLWAKFTWGAWWVDDPQLNGAFVTVMVYAGYLVLRSSVQDEALRTRLSAVYNLFGFCLLVVLLMVLPRFTESLHPGKGGNPAFSSYDLDSALRAVFYPAVLGWMILGTWMYAKTLHLERLRAALAESRLQRATQAGLPFLLLSTPSWSEPLVNHGKMGVVVGVAVIIGLGLGLWSMVHSRQARALNQEMERPS
jgi:heme exporter protein C